MRPLIGVTPDYNPGHRKITRGGEPTFFLRARYARAIREGGGVPVVLPPCGDPAEIRRWLGVLSGVLLTGSGPDIDPAVYGEKRKFPFDLMSRERSEFEIALARAALRRDVPILGICGGMQILNVACGGTLIQDIRRQIKRPLNHRRGHHAIRLAPDTLLSRIFQRGALRVNSSHHQAVARIGRGLIADAHASDSIIEGIEAPDARFAVGVQWHPECVSDKDPVQNRLFRAFIAAATKG